MKKTYYFIVIISFLIFSSLGVYLYVSWRQFLKTPIIPANQSQQYIFHSGENIKSLADYLSLQANLKHPYYFIFLGIWTGQAKQLKAGEYLFQGGILPKELLTQIQKGDVVHHALTIIEGWTFNQIISALNQAPMLQHTLRNKSSQAIMQLVCASENNCVANNPEGLFFPNTYRYVMATSDLDLLKEAYGLMQQKLDAAWKIRSENLPYKTSYQALIIASMIEKEAKLSEERSLIAGVIVNRINKNMYLQIDPTIIYGLGNKYQGFLTPLDLRINSPYNTYLRKGLPPTPIGVPSEQSIIAAVRPANTLALYFVAKGDGSHYFSDTLKEHNAAVNKYLIATKNTTDAPETLCLILGNRLELLCPST